MRDESANRIRRTRKQRCLVPWGEDGSVVTARRSQVSNTPEFGAIKQKNISSIPPGRERVNMLAWAHSSSKIRADTTRNNSTGRYNIN